MGVSPSEFISLYGSQSGRSGAASASSNAGIPLEIGGQDGDGKSPAAQRCYIKRDAPSILSVSLATMGQPARRAPAPFGPPCQLEETTCPHRRLPMRQPIAWRESLPAPSRGSSDLSYLPGHAPASLCFSMALFVPTPTYQMDFGTAQQWACLRVLG